jgi:hypothetical protein
MIHRKLQSEQFKLKGKNILEGRPCKINSVEGFLNGTTNAQIYKDASPQNPNSTDELGMRKENLIRLHIQIRQDLAQAMHELVFKRKCDSKFKGRRATQRGIIEEALESYFKGEGLIIENDD